MSIFVVILSPGADDGLVVGVDDEAEDLVDLDDMDRLDEFEELFPIVERVLSARERNGMDRDIDRISINITLALIDLLIGRLLSLANPLFRQEFHSTLLEAGGLKITPERY